MVKTYEEINAKINNGEAVVITAEEMISVVEEHGVEYAAKEIDVVTTGTFGAMCSSGAFLNWGHSDPPIKPEDVWVNGVSAYHGNAAADVYIGVTRMAEPRNFDYGGGHVIEDLLRGKKVHVSATAYGTDCYPATSLETDVSLADLNQAILCNPRNAYQHYACAVNGSNKTIYTYMGKLLPNYGNATYSGAGQLAPLLNDPDFETIGAGTHIFLAGGDGVIIQEGTQHSPKSLFGTLMVSGDMKNMSAEYFRGASFKGYGTSAYVGIGVPIPILNENIAKKCAIRDDQIVTDVLDYSTGRLSRPKLREVTYAELKSGKIELNGREIKVASLSSLYKARKIADELKEWIKKGKFPLYKPYRQLSTTTEFHKIPEAHSPKFVKNLAKPAITVLETAGLKSVAEAFIQHNTNHLVVVDEERHLRGLITTFDLAKSVAGGGTTIKDIMIPRGKVYRVKESDPADIAVRTMQKFGISSLPVLDPQECVVGLITAEELIEAQGKKGGQI